MSEPVLPGQPAPPPESIAVTASAPPESRAVVLRALSWSTVGTAASLVLLLTRTLLLPRLLAPEEFGLFGLVWFALSAVSTFSDPAMGRVALGLRFADAQEERRFLDTAWTFNLVRSAVLSALIGLAALPYASVMQQPRLAPLLAASAASLVLGSWGSPGTIQLFRTFDQRTLALQRISTEVVTLAVTAAAAWRTHSAWALVLGSLLGALLGAAASYVGQPYRPRPCWDRVQLSRGVRLGRHIGTVNALTFVTTQVDNLIVGKVLGPAVLGTYQLAYRMGSLPIESLQQVVSSAALPAYTRLRERGTHAVAQRLQLTLSASTALLCAALLPALLLRRELVLVVGGARWLAAAPLLLPVFLLALLRSSNIQLGTLLLAMERTDLDARVKMIEACFFVPCCALLVVEWGSAGAAWAGASSYLLALVLRGRTVLSILPGEGPRLRAAWARPALSAIACAAVGLFAERAGAPPLLVAPVLLALFCALALWLDPALPRELRALRKTQTEI